MVNTQQTLSWQERKNKENAEAADWSKKNGLPELVGSPKQIAWAESIRKNAIEIINRRAWDMEVTGGVNAYYYYYLMEAIRKFFGDIEADKFKSCFVDTINEFVKNPSAKYWIDNRNCRGLTSNGCAVLCIEKIRERVDAYLKDAMSVPVKHKFNIGSVYYPLVLKGEPQLHNIIIIDRFGTFMTVARESDEREKHTTKPIHLFGVEIMCCNGVTVWYSAKNSITKKTVSTKKAEKVTTKTPRTNTKTKRVTRRTPKHGMTACEIESAIKDMTEPQKKAYLTKLNKTLPENQQKTTYKNGIKKSAYAADAQRKSLPFGWRLKSDRKHVYYEGRASHADSYPEIDWHGDRNKYPAKLKELIGYEAKKKTTTKKKENKRG